MDEKLLGYIPAGHEPGVVSEVAALAGVENKALIPLNGKPIISYVLKALDDAETISSILVAGLSQDDINYQASKPIEFIPSTGKGFETVMTMVRHLERSDTIPSHIVGLSSDIPFLTGKIIDANVSQVKSLTPGKDLYYPLIHKDKMLEQFPFANKRFRKFKEAVVGTGDVYVFNPMALLRKETADAIEKMMDNRKYMLRILLKFSKLAPIKYLLGRLSIYNDVVPFMRRGIYVDMETYFTNYGEIFLDLDYVEDLHRFEDEIKSLKV